MTEQFEILPAAACLPGLIQMRAEAKDKIAFWTEQERSLTGAIEHLRRSIGVADPAIDTAAPLAALGLGSKKPAPITDQLVIQALHGAGAPLTIDEISKMLRPDGDKARTYSAVQRVIYRKNGGQPSLVERGFVTVSQSRPARISLTAVAARQLQSAVNKA